VKPTFSILATSTVLGIALASAIPSTGIAQDPSGTTGAAIAGGALGASSGTLLGTMASIPPCLQTYAGVRCVRWGVGIGAAVGLASGILIGAADSDRVSQSATSAAIGFGVGIVAGLALTPVAQRFGWRDVVAVGLMGGAVGSAPVGAAIGAGAGAVAGALLLGTVNGFTMPDAVAAGVVGMSLGALTEWVVAAINAQTNGGSQPGFDLVLPMRLTF
jgi:hypothetical protein